MLVGSIRESAISIGGNGREISKEKSLRVGVGQLRKKFMRKLSKPDSYGIGREPPPNSF